MIVVTGAAGFIGSNLVRALNGRGRDDVIAVDEFSDGHKCVNLADCRIADYYDRDEWRELVGSGAGPLDDVETVFHLGACSDTTQWDGRYMMEANFSYSRALLEMCASRGVPLVYASSAAVYGNGTAFAERPGNERPLNMYGYSKLAFDQLVRHRLERLETTVIGLRYFNVYGPREQHKGRMASVVHHMNAQIRDGGRVRLFEGSHGYDDGEQRRDFVHVDDVVDVTLWCAQQPAAGSGIYNCGTGRAEPFNAVARAVIAWHGHGEIEYVPFPPELVGAYQAFTEADITRLRAQGYDGQFRSVADGVREYLNWLNS